MENGLIAIASASAVVSLLVAAVLCFYFFLKAKSRERMALIDRGIDLSLFYREPNRHLSLRIGVFHWCSCRVVHGSRHSLDSAHPHCGFSPCQDASVGRLETDTPIPNASPVSLAGTG